MNALRVSVVIIWLAAAVSVAAFAQGALGLLTDSDPVGGNTFATASCFAGDTGFLNPSAEAADSGGDGDGFESLPTNGFADGSGVASSLDGAGDRHRYYAFGVSLDSSCVIAGIEVQLDWYLDDTLGTNDMDVELSWDGGTSWTAAKTDTVASTSEHTTVLGGLSDTWGHAWTASELSDANFRVRLTSNSTDSTRDFFLDWVPVKVHYVTPIFCVSGDTGLLDPAAEAADGGGNGSGFEISPTNAFVDDAAYGSNIDGAGDRHRYYDYGISFDSGCNVVGIEARLDWWLDSTAQTSSMSVELSWDGGTSWTESKTDAVESASEHTTVLGNSSDTWGRSWTASELNDANFRVRLTSNSSKNTRDFFLDWVSVKVHYVAPPSNAVSILDAWTIGTTHAVSAGTDRLLLVGVYGEDSGVIDSVNTVTWGGQTLTEINEATVGGGYSNLVWLGYLNDAGIAAASGSTIVATWSGTMPNESVLYAAVTLESVDQTTPSGGSSTGSSTSASTVQIASSLSVDTSDMTVYVTGTGEQGRTHTANTGYTEGTEQDSGGVGQVASNATKAITANGGEQPTATWSGTNNRLAIIGAVINVAP